MNKHCLTHKSLLSLAILSSLSVPAFADEDKKENKKEEIESFEVTGSRLKMGDPSVRVESIGIGEIRARGLVSAEDIVRTIPQNLSSINSATNLDIDGALDTNLGSLGSGTATANLRGLGSDYTLVLLNGRRMAGTAGQQGFFANLKTIPADAIERVDILLDGGSAVYGSDAVAGVINIITRKDFTGGNIVAQRDSASNGGGFSKISGSYGINWDSGNFSANIGYSESTPISTRKAGFVTRDHSAKFGGNTDYDYRNEFFLSRPSLIVVPAGADPRFFRFPPYDFIVPEGNGVGLKPEDLKAPTQNDWGDDIFVDASGKTADTSLMLNFSQDITNDLTVETIVTATRSRTSTLAAPQTGGLFFVPASNAFSPYHNLPKDEQRDVWVNYDPVFERENGLIGGGFQNNTSTLLQFDLGVDYALNDSHTLNFEYTYSESTRDTTQLEYGQRTERHPRYRNVAQEEKIKELLASSDPNVAINLFGDGTKQNPGVKELLIPISRGDQVSTNESVNLYLSGDIFELPAGSIRYALGTQYRVEGLTGNDKEGIFERNGVEKPERKLQAYYAEANIPLIAEANNVPFVENLTLTLQARYDKYKILGGKGRETETIVNDKGEEVVVDKLDADGRIIPILTTSTFSNLSPRFGLAWDLNKELKITAGWQESFKAPVFSDLFTTNNHKRTMSNFVFDPLAEGFPFVPAYTLSGPNLNLKPETAKTKSLGLIYEPAWSEGTRFKVSYSDIRLRDRISGSFELGQLLPKEVYGNMKEFFIRDENGKLLESISRPINISERRSETLDIEINSSFETSFGAFTPRIYYTRVLNLHDRAIPESEPKSFVGFFRGIDKYKVITSMGWNYNSWAGEVIAKYTPSYINDSDDLREKDLPLMKVDSYTTVDLNLKYDFGNGLAVRVGGRNIFDADFPFAINGFGKPYDAKRVDLKGRVVYGEVSYSF
ncbi:TonB-dependent receptor [Parashewanella curva]|uniref:TonB-dependent receptor n=1 Tax=Parashewanella curva TaxID=2338552 RepID=A0A3L8PWP9_9GAMM|nr:TonB-dependent receptor [Parashewanella curva]RLV59877.1 TonB-dependent receptor [Parashewanella curva]